jgi:hypothetical protein
MWRRLVICNWLPDHQYAKSSIPNKLDSNTVIW